jgi:PAS domain-containing protein
MTTTTFLNDGTDPPDRLRITHTRAESARDIHDRVVVASGRTPGMIFFHPEENRFIDLVSLFARVYKPRTRKKIAGKWVPYADPLPAVSVASLYKEIRGKGYDPGLHAFFVSYLSTVLAASAAGDAREFRLNLENEITSLPIEEFSGVYAFNTDRLDCPREARRIREVMMRDLNGVLRASITREPELLRETEDRVAALQTESSELDNAAPLEVIREETSGSIISFSVRTDKTTGEVFNGLALEVFPAASYRGFFRVGAASGGFQGLDIPELSTDDALRVYDTDGRALFYLDNTPAGLSGQAILYRDGAVSDGEALSRFLGLTVRDMLTIGIMREVVYRHLGKGVDPSLFSFLAMNDPLFSKYVRVNDTEKISKNNHSVFLYYIDPTEKEDTTKADIRVGWSRFGSRIGNLTAILVPSLGENGGAVSVIRIARSGNERTVRAFQDIIGRLLRIYEEKCDELLEIFKKRVPSFVRYEPEPVAHEARDDALGRLPRNIFVPEYTRACQGPKPVPITDAEAGAIDDASLKLRFPPVARDGFVPTWYRCPSEKWRGKAYKHPGLIMLSSPNHPFGYAPCCYKEVHKNTKEIMDDIRFFVENGAYRESFRTISVAALPKKRPVETDSHVIQYVGQEGSLPADVQTFMKVLFPSRSFRRMGCSPWKTDSLLGCLEFRRAMTSADKTMRSPQDLRRLLLELPLEVASQENYDHGLAGLRALLEAMNAVLDFRRVVRLVEEFYKVGLFVFSRDAQGRIDYVVPEFYRQHLATFEDVVRSRPVVFLLEHETDLHYELLIARPDIDAGAEYETAFACTDEVYRVLRHTLLSFTGDRPATARLYRPLSSSVLNRLVTAQMIDVYGKCRGVVLERRYTVLFKQPIAPLVIRRHDGEYPIPTNDELLGFLREKGLTERSAFRRRGFTVAVVRDFLDLYFLARDDAAAREDNDPRKTCIDVFSVIREPTGVVASTTDRLRLATVLKEAVVFFFSCFLHEQRSGIGRRGVEELVQSFFNNCVRFVAERDLEYGSIHDIHPRIQRSLHTVLLRDGRILLPKNIEQKIRYYVSWFAGHEPDTVEKFRELVEFPSYYMFCDDFSPLPRHVLQTSLTPFRDTRETVHEAVPLEAVRVPVGRLFFYLNPPDTPKPVPYFAFVEDDEGRGLAAATYFAHHRTLPETPEEGKEEEVDYEVWSAESGWPRSRESRFCVFPRERDAVYLLPIDPIRKK